MTQSTQPCPRVSPLRSRFQVIVLCGGLMYLAGCAEGPAAAEFAELTEKVDKLVVVDGEIHHEEVEFGKVLQTPGKTVLVDFWATWCPPCMALTPELENVAATEEDVIIVKVNLDKSDEVAVALDVAGIPDLRVFRDGEQIRQHNGFKSADELRAWLE